MTVENVTSNRNYPRPYRTNDMKDDVERIDDALEAIDADMQSVIGDLSDKAPLVSPAFTGTPTAPTATPGDDSGKIASTAFVQAAILALIGGAPGALDTLNELAAALADDENFAATVTNALALKQDIADNGLISGYRNDVMNGDFDVWQRGTSFTMSSAFYAADRWRVEANETLPNGGTPSTISRQAHALGQTSVPGNPRYFLRISKTSGAGTGTGIRVFQPIKNGARRRGGQRVTRTIYLRGTVGKSVTPVLVKNYGTGGSPTTEEPIAAADVVLASATDFQKVTVAFDVPTNAGKTFGTDDNDYIGIGIRVPDGQGAVTVDMSHVSMVPGDATGEDDPFSPVPLSITEHRCRMFYQTDPGNGVNTNSWYGDAVSGNTYRTRTAFCPPMDKEPVVALINGAYAGFNSGTHSVISGTDRYGFRTQCTASSTAAGRAFNAGWTASAEVI